MNQKKNDPPTTIRSPTLKNGGFRTSIGRSYALVAFGAYLAAEIFNFTGLQSSLANDLTLFGGISSYGLSADRERDLVAHLLAQSLVLPAYAVINQRGISEAILARKPMGAKAFFGGIFLTILLGLILYTPAQSQSNPDIHRFNLIHIFVTQSNLAYSLAMGFCVALIALGMQVPATQSVRLFKNLAATWEKQK